MDADEDMLGAHPGAGGLAGRHNQRRLESLNVLPLLHFARQLALIGGFEQADPADFAQIHPHGVVYDVHIFQALDPLAVYVRLVRLIFFVVIVRLLILRCAVSPGQDHLRLRQAIPVLPRFACAYQFARARSRKHYQIISAIAIHRCGHMRNTPLD